MSGRVLSIHLADAGSAPMRSVPWADAVPGGLAGDRYLLGTGHWSSRAVWRNDVTLVAAEDLAAAEAEHGVALGGGASRRNLLTEGVDLGAVVGARLRVGEAVLRADRPCDPCRYLDGLVGGAAQAALTGRGGLRATVLVPGRLAVGDAVEVLPPEAAASPTRA